MRRSKLTKEEKQAMSDVINQVLNMNVDWTKLKDSDLIAVFKRFSNRIAVTGGIVGAIANDWANTVLSIAEQHVNDRIANILQELKAKKII